MASSSGCGREFSSRIAFSSEACFAFNASMWSTVLIGDLRAGCELPKTLTPQMRRVTPNRVPRRAVHKSGRMVRMTDPSQPPKRLIIGISGASGAIYGVRLLQALKLLPVETHLVMTHTA